MEIKATNERIADKESEECVQALSDFFIFGLDTSRSESSVLRMFQQNSMDFLCLFLLRLKLYLKYEGRSLLLPAFHFKTLQKLLSFSTAHFADLDSFTNRVMKQFNLVLSVCSKVFLRDESQSVRKEAATFTFDSIQSNLLFHMKECVVFTKNPFWKALFEFKFNKSPVNSNMPKFKVLKVAETMMFYHFFVSNDVQTSQKIVESVIDQSVNLKLMNPVVRMRVADSLYSVFQSYRQSRFKHNKLMPQKEKLLTVLEAIHNSGLLTPKDFKGSLFLDRYLSINLLTAILRRQLGQSKMSTEVRKRSWVAYIKLCDVLEAKTVAFHRTLGPEMLEQIRIDVIRTKQWKGPGYAENIKGLITSFFERHSAKFEYFQGFNFIVSFVFEVFHQSTEATVVLEFICRNMLSVWSKGVFH